MVYTLAGQGEANYILQFVLQLGITQFESREEKMRKLISVTIMIARVLRIFLFS